MQENNSNSSSNSNGNSNGKTPRIRRSKRQIHRECNHIYSLLTEGKTHQEVQAITGLKEDTYYRYLRELRKQYGKQFIEQGDNINDEIALSTQMLYDRLCKLYSLCVQRLTNCSDTNSRNYSETVKVAEELSINLHRLREQGAMAAIEIARRYNTIDIRSNRDTNDDIDNNNWNRKEEQKKWYRQYHGKELS
jgi:hypothetical protein